METKFKVGDKVLLNKPKEQGVGEFIWISSMDKFDGEVFVVKETGGRAGRYYCTNDETTFFLPESWLTKVGEGIIKEEPKTEERKPIDWETRRWELVCRILAQESMSIADGIEYADVIIKQYKQTLK